jgi:hypothetical protein
MRLKEAWRKLATHQCGDLEHMCVTLRHSLDLLVKHATCHSRRTRAIDQTVALTESNG